MSHSTPLRGSIIRVIYARISWLPVILSTVFLALVASSCGMLGAGFGKDVLAVVNGENITVQDLKTACDDEIPSDPEKRNTELQRLINNRLASRAAIAGGLLGSPDVLSGIEEYYNNALPDYLLKKMADAVVVTDEEMKANRPTDVKPVLGVSVLVAPTEKDAETALVELKKGGDFKAVAAKYSTVKGETEKEVNFAEGLYPVGVIAVLNRLKPGEISPIMKMDIGYGVFKLNYRKEPEQLISAAEGSLRKEIKARKFEVEKAKLIDKLRSAADIKMEKRTMPGGVVQYLGATVNGVVIQMNPLLFSQAGDPHSMHQGMNAKTLNDALNKRINNVLLSQEARRQGIHNDPEFQRALQLKKEELLSNAVLEKIRGEYNPEPKDIKEYYDNNKEKFTSKTKVHVSRILLSTEADAKAVLKDLKDGKDFAVEARQKSTDTTAEKTGGDVGFVSIDMLKEPMKSVLAKLKVGEVSDVLKSEYGYEVLKVTERKEGAPGAMSIFTTTIKKRVKLTKESERVEAFYKSLYDKADVKINKELLKSLRN